MHVAIIGAGLSGLASAHRLAEAGHTVELFEEADQPGGRCKMEERDGYLMDLCPELASTNYRRWLNLIREVGLGDDIVICPSAISILKDGQLMDIDMGRLSSVAFTPALSLRAKLAMAIGMVRLRPMVRRMPHYMMDDVGLDDPHGNAAMLSTRIFGVEATRYLIEPMLRPIAGVTLDMASTMLLPHMLADWSQMATLRGGLQRLPITLAARHRVHYRRKVTSVVSGDKGVVLEITDDKGWNERRQFDKCLITIPYDQAEAIYPRFAEISGGYRNEMTFMRMLDIKVAYRRAPASKAAMVMLPVSESPLLNVISLSHNKAPDRAPAGQALFSIFTEHKCYDQLSVMSDAEIEALARNTVERLYPELAGQFLFSRIARQERVSYVPDRGFFHRTKRLWDAIGSEPRVHLGGDIFMFGGMEAAVASGERAAVRLMQGADTGH